MAIVSDIQGFSSWGLSALVGEAGDLGNYPNPAKLHKRLGLAPDDAYPTGEKRKGRMIPRACRGRIFGMIADPLFKHQWRGEKDGVAPHAIGPYGVVYAAAKAKGLASGKTKKHADVLARRIMLKALVLDAWCAWHGRPLRYHKDASQEAEGATISRVMTRPEVSLPPSNPVPSREGRTMGGDQ